MTKPDSWWNWRWLHAGHRQHGMPIVVNLKPHAFHLSYVGQAAFPVALYPHAEDLPTHRREIDLYPELRR